MFGFFKKENIEEKVVPDPKVGEKWELDRDTDDPFPPKNDDRREVDIIDIKNGWVRYYIGSLFPDNRMSIKRFKAIYRKVGA